MAINVLLIDDIDNFMHKGKPLTNGSTSSVPPCSSFSLHFPIFFLIFQNLQLQIFRKVSWFLFGKWSVLWVRGIRNIIVFPPLPNISFSIILLTSHSQVCDEKSNTEGFIRTGQPFCFLFFVQMKNLFFLQDHEQSDRKPVVLAGYVSRGEQTFVRKR